MTGVRCEVNAVLEKFFILVNLAAVLVLVYVRLAFEFSNIDYVHF